CRPDFDPNDADGDSFWKRVAIKDAKVNKRLMAPMIPVYTQGGDQVQSTVASFLPTVGHHQTDVNFGNTTAAVEPNTAAVGSIPIGGAVNSDPVPAVGSLPQVAVGDQTDMDLDLNSIESNLGNGSATPVVLSSAFKGIGKVFRPRTLRIPLHNAFPADSASSMGEWRQMGSPVYHLDSNTNSVLAASMLMRPTINNENWLENRQVLLYKLPDLANPIAICGSDLWADASDNGSDVSHLMDIRHYPDTIVNGEMRVVMIVVFGLNARPATQDESDLQILDVWKVVKAVEIWLPIDPRFTASITTPPNTSNPWVFESNPTPPQSLLKARKGKIERIEPGRGDADLRGRIAKLYRASVPKLSLSKNTMAAPTNCSEGSASTSTSTSTSTRENEEMVMVDCLALFGIQNSDNSSAIVIKKILFLDDKDIGNSSYTKKQISRTVSCMAVFPCYSNYERMIVLFNRHGRGLIWDWVNERQVAQLHMHVDKLLSQQAELAKTNISDPVLTQAATAAAEEAASSSLYYWGAQVNWAIEVPYPKKIDSRANQLFRIVILADGDGSEWESTWWHVDSAILGNSEKDLEAPPIIPIGQPRVPWKASAGPPEILYANAKRYQSETVGYCLDEQRKSHEEEDGKQLQFIALGLTIYDMEEEGATKKTENTIDRQWVTFLKNTAENPLVDIATVGDNLVITRRFGQTIWPFYGHSLNK
ncbi:hypothetical protein BGZ49_003800, partial [Haplosporangium sp. Z 27]